MVKFVYFLFHLSSQTKLYQDFSFLLVHNYLKLKICYQETYWKEAVHVLRLSLPSGLPLVVWNTFIFAYPYWGIVGEFLLLNYFDILLWSLFLVIFVAVNYVLGMEFLEASIGCSIHESWNIKTLLGICNLYSMSFLSIGMLLKNLVYITCNKRNKVYF